MHQRNDGIGLGVQALVLLGASCYVRLTLVLSKSAVISWVCSLVGKNISAFVVLIMSHVRPQIHTRCYGDICDSGWVRLKEITAILIRAELKCCLGTTLCLSWQQAPKFLTLSNIAGDRKYRQNKYANLMERERKCIFCIPFSWPVLTATELGLAFVSDNQDSHLHCDSSGSLRPADRNGTSHEVET